MAHSTRTLRVLHIEDEEKESQLVTSELRKVSTRFHLARVCEENELLDALKSDSWDFVLCNFHSRCLPARECLRHVKTIHGDLPFILVSGPVGEEIVAALMKDGADDFILKGNYFRLEAIIKRLLMDRDMRGKAEKAQRRAFEAFAARERMLAVVSHDIKNPLSAIHLEAQMLLRTAERYGKSVLGEEVKVQAGRILKTAERMKTLIADLLDTNKGQDALRSLQKTSVDPVQLFCDSLDNVRPLISEKQIEVKFSPRENTPSINLDRNKVFQVFSNLLSNSIKFTPQKGKIYFDLNWNEDTVFFTITDSGPGVINGEEEKVFDKYWTGKKSPRSGTGLGLFICKSIIESHGGTISCSNVEGKGASFMFSLPRHDEIYDGIPDGQIFIVDDDEDLCEVMCWSLKKEGYSIRSFASGRSALKALEHVTPAVLIVDFHLGDMNGREFLKRLPESAGSCPTILISGSPDEVRSSVPREEYDVIVEKPLDLEGLLHEVRLVSGPCLQKSSNEASRHTFHGPASAG